MQRRQNIACDQCRNRKVKCNQLPGEDRCQHCISKNYPCTHHAQQETEKRRSSTTRRLNRNPTPTNSTAPTVTNVPPSVKSSPPDYGADHDTRDGPESHPASISRDSAIPSSSYPTPFLYSDSAPPPSSPFSATSVPPIIYERQQTLPLPYIPPERATSTRFQVTQYPYPGLPPPPNAPIQDFLAYLFSPDPSMNTPEHIALQSPEASRAKRKLLEQDYRVDFATELLEVYFQVYHPRIPIVNPTRFRAQFREALFPTFGRDNINMRGDDFSAPFHGGRRESSSSSTSAESATLKPIHRPLLATLLAWGSKFSDHSLLVLDRQQAQQDLSRSASTCSSSTRCPAPERHGSNHAGGRRAPQRSNISRLLVDRAREVSEQDKVFRIALPENVVVCLLLEPLQPLQSYPPTDPQGIKCLWLNAGIRHLMEMQVNRHPSNPIPAAIHPTGDPDEWGCMVFCWWLACIADALCCAYFKKKPALSEGDYDLAEFQLASHPRSETPVSAASPPQEKPSPSVHDSLARGDPPQRWYSALHDLAVCSRYMAETLWIPATERDGIPYVVVENTFNILMRWRDEHLATVGATNDLQSHADYVAAVGACTSDCSYNVLWIILSQTIEDFGIKEVNEAMRGLSTPVRVLPNGNGTGASSSSTPVGIPIHLTPMVELERAVANEAFKSATRIAGLAGVLTSNGYMRLDPNAIHWPMYCAGRLLARLGRQEVFNCIDGLNQNGYAYEESWEHARELEHAYTVATTSGGGPLDSETLMHRYLKGTPRMGVLPLANGRRPMSLIYDTLSANHEQPNLDVVDRYHFEANFSGHAGHPLAHGYSPSTSS